jgi:hypothetical protein
MKMGTIECKSEHYNMFGYSYSLLTPFKTFSKKYVTMALSLVLSLTLFLALENPKNEVAMTITLKTLHL